MHANDLATCTHFIATKFKNPTCDCNNDKVCCLYLLSSPKCGDKVEVYASGWIVGTSCPASQGQFNKEIILGKSIPFALNVGEIKMTTDTSIGNGRGFRVQYSFEGVYTCSIMFYLFAVQFSSESLTSVKLIYTNFHDPIILPRK